MINMSTTTKLPKLPDPLIFSKKGTLCSHVMKGGPRKDLICDRPNCMVTPWGDRCFHHTPERMAHQANKERCRLAAMTPIRREFERGEELIRRTRRAKKARAIRDAELKEIAELEEDFERGREDWMS